MRFALLVPWVLLGAIPFRDGQRLEVIADTSIAMHPGEERLNLGGRSSLRIKGIHNVLLMNLDVAPLRGRRVEEARLFLRTVSPHHLKIVGVSSVSAPWNEGQSNGPAAKGECSLLEAAKGERPWSYPGSDFLSVVFSEGGSIWSQRDVRDEADGWISIDLPPALLHAIVEGKSHGIAISDDKNQTMANNDVYAREQSSSKPYVMVLRSSVGAPPPSGAKLYTDVAKPEPKIVEPAFPPKYEKPASPSPAKLPDGGTYKILHEADASPDAAPAGRIWDGKALTLDACRGEHVGFLIAVETPDARPIRISGDGWTASRLLDVGPAFDPLVPVGGDVKGKALFHVERLVPKSAAPGVSRAPLKVSTGKAEIEIPATLRVHSAVLPDALSFKVSLNSYMPPGDADLVRSFHRLAHEHRATMAIVSYTQRGNMHAGYAPATKRSAGKVEISSWDAFDAYWTPLCDGSAFRGLPRDGAPLDHAYLPFHENWPLPINEFYSYRGSLENHWKDAPPIEKAFAPEYGQAFTFTVRDFAKHVQQKKWATDFHLFLNNKPFVREKGQNEGPWWCLDEPYSADDFLALKYYAALFKQGMKEAGPAPLRFRIDLSRPHWRRDHLNGLIDLDVISGIYRQYPRFVFGRGEDVWIYGGVPAPGAPGDSGRAWVIQSFLDGADGALPWQTLGGVDSWSKPDENALLLPPRPGLEPRAYATHRLKLLRRAQSDVELLRLVLAKKKLSRTDVRRPVAELLGLQGTFRQSSADDAGQVDYGKLDADRFEFFRRTLLSALD